MQTIRGASNPRDLIRESGLAIFAHGHFPTAAKRQALGRFRRIGSGAQMHASIRATHRSRWISRITLLAQKRLDHAVAASGRAGTWPQTTQTTANAGNFTWGGYIAIFSSF